MSYIIYNISHIIYHISYITYIYIIYHISYSIYHIIYHISYSVIFFINVFFWVQPCKDKPFFESFVQSHAFLAYLQTLHLFGCAESPFAEALRSLGHRRRRPSRGPPLPEATAPRLSVGSTGGGEAKDDGNLDGFMPWHSQFYSDFEMFKDVLKKGTGFSKQYLLENIRF